MIPPLRRLWAIAAFLLVAGAVTFLWVRSIHNHAVAPEVPSLPTPASPGQASPAATAPEGQASSPLQIGFLAAAGPAPGQAADVTLVVQATPGAWPEAAAGDLQLEFLLRLPVGVRLESKDWTPAELPPEEQEDSSGPWFLFERRIAVQVPAGAPPSELARVQVPLAVVEEGTNWIITVRVRVIKGSQAWQTFGILFATLQGKAAEFHTMPKSLPPSAGLSLNRAAKAARET